MKFTVSSSNLLKHLSYVSGVIATNPSLPILENFLFIAEGTKLSIVGTDTQTTIKTDLEIMNAKENGKICVPSKIIQDYLKSIAEQSITFGVDVKTSTIKITTTNGTYKFKGEDAQYYPKEQSDAKTQNLHLKNSTLLEGINYTLFTVANDESRPNMNGLLFELEQEEKQINFVATDGHRLVKYTAKNDSITDKTSFIVPKKPLSILKNLIPDNDQELNIKYNKNHLFIRTEDITIICTLLDATFPDYRSVIPTNNPFFLTIAAQELQQALKRVSIFSSKSNNLVRFSIKGGELALSAKDEDFDFDADEKLLCQYDGEDIVIGFNSKSVIELLNSIKIGEVVINMSMPSKPVLLKPAENQENTELVMLQIPLILMSE